MTIEAKTLTNGLLATTTGATATTAFTIGAGEILLYVVGVVISVIAFLHHETHTMKSDNYIKFTVKGMRYIAIGVFAFPSAYAYAGIKVWSYVPFQALSGTLVTFAIVLLFDAWMSGKSKELGGSK